MTLLFYAAFHMVPILIVGALTNSRKAVTVTGVIMAVVAIFVGNFIIIDLAAVALGLFLSGLWFVRQP
jgi:uncharacterized membrane protein YgdD (TMEM256/DUF423 family)